MKACDEHIGNDRTLIIFPEGTRVNYGKNIEIKKGVLRILDFNIFSVIYPCPLRKYYERKY
jgi:hypothetical protein